MQIDHWRYLLEPRPYRDKRDGYEWEDFDCRLEAPEMLPTGSTTFSLGMGVRYEPDFVIRSNVEPLLEWWRAQDAMFDQIRAQMEQQGNPEVAYL